MEQNILKSGSARSLRLWPGVILAIVLVLLRYVLFYIEPRSAFLSFMGGMFLSIAILVWWVFFSRAPKFEKWGGLIIIILSLAVINLLNDISIATANMGMMYIMYALPVVCVALVLWAALTRKSSVNVRRSSMIITLLVASGFWVLLRTDGMTGDASHKLNWRWAKTPEDRLLEQTEGESLNALADTAIFNYEPEWPGFRGKDRNGIVTGLEIATDWIVSPPSELWRKPVGPGCSSFAISGNYIYTHEQLGEYETVSCYTLDEGKPVWKHKDKARFYDSHAGPGPRATPTLARGRLYTLGGTGILNVIDASDGELIWSVNAAERTGTEVRTWGICGSPVITDSLVIVSVSGNLAAFSISKGELAWQTKDGGSGYSSPQLVTLDNTPQVLLMNGSGIISVEPGSGKMLWNYSWPLDDRVLQPTQVDENDILINEEYRGVKRISVSRDGSGFKIEEVWMTPEVKMLYNDFVIHKGYAYGFDGPSMACLDLKEGKRTWRGERYRGFQLLLADQDLILVLSEKGELALVKADPSRFTELGRIQVLTGKTWNHPALAGSILVVRNSQEMAAYKITR